MSFLNFGLAWGDLGLRSHFQLRLKKKGARFDKNSKKWYVPSNLDYDKFYKFWPQELKISNDARGLASLIAP